MPATLAFFCISSVADDTPERSIPPHQTSRTIARPSPDPVAFRIGPPSFNPCFASGAPPDIQAVPFRIELAETPRIPRCVVVLVAQPLRQQREAVRDRHLSGDASPVDREGIRPLVRESGIGAVEAQTAEDETDRPFERESAFAMLRDQVLELLR